MMPQPPAVGSITSMPTSTWPRFSSSWICLRGRGSLEECSGPGQVPVVDEVRLGAVELLELGLELGDLLIHHLVALDPLVHDDLGLGHLLGQAP